jgi:hypothetical protein
MLHVSQTPKKPYEKGGSLILFFHEIIQPKERKKKEKSD